MEEATLEVNALESAIARAQQEAGGAHKRYVVTEESPGTYAVWPLDRYKQLQVPDPIVATALPDGELRR